MHIESWGLSAAGPNAAAEAARPGLLRRVMARLGATRTVELDEHLAQDTGHRSYELPLFAASWADRPATRRSGGGHV